VKLTTRLSKLFALLLYFCTLSFSIAGENADEPGRAIMLVATSKLAGSVYEQSVLVAAPLARGGHIGFIINRPTNVKLAALFPDQAGCRDVVDPVYVGGMELSNAVFALARGAPAPDPTGTIEFMPGLVAVIDGTAIDRVIQSEPTSARFFVGAAVWAPGELEAQIQEGAWDVRPANRELVFRTDSSNLWNQLHGPTRESTPTRAWI
jgi:putative transcriptional regulator